MLSFPRAKIPLVVLLFLVLHLTVLSRLRIGGAAPDVMLLLAIAAGVVGGPQLGALLGFSAGLVLDLFLETPLGLSALVFCLFGYGVGNIQAGVLRASWWIPVLTALGASIAGELVYAVVATVIGEPHLVTTHLLVIAAVVGAFNAVAAPIALRLVRWSTSGPDRRAYI